MARYLVKDYLFLDSFLVLLGAALTSADTFADRLRFGRFIGMVSAESDAAPGLAEPQLHRPQGNVPEHSHGLFGGVPAGRTNYWALSPSFPRGHAGRDRTAKKLEAAPDAIQSHPRRPPAIAHAALP